MGSFVVTVVPGAGLLAFAPKPPALPTEGRTFAEAFLSPPSALGFAALPFRCVDFVPAFPAALTAILVSGETR